jgi:hypothetical protein
MTRNAKRSPIGNLKCQLWKVGESLDVIRMKFAATISAVLAGVVISFEDCRSPLRPSCRCANSLPFRTPRWIFQEFPSFLLDHTSLLGKAWRHLLSNRLFVITNRRTELFILALSGLSAIGTSPRRFLHGLNHRWHAGKNAATGLGTVLGIFRPWSEFHSTVRAVNIGQCSTRTPSVWSDGFRHFPMLSKSTVIHKTNLCQR